MASNPIPSAAQRLVDPRSGTITVPWMLWMSQLAAATPSSDAVHVANVYRFIAGLDPDKLSTNVLNINPGSCVDADATAIYSSDAVIAVDMSTNGANGLDTGAPVDGTGYFPYMIVNDTSGELACVLSASIIYSGVTVPAGYTMVRKLPFGFVYNSTRGGIPDFHLSGWPQPFIRFTGAESTSNWRALASGNAAAWANVSVAAWVPDNARMALLHCRAETPAAALPGFAYVRVIGSQLTGLEVGNPAAGLDTYSLLPQRITSDLKFQYQVTNGTKLSVFVLGYYMTEPV